MDLFPSELRALDLSSEWKPVIPLEAFFIASVVVGVAVLLVLYVNTVLTLMQRSPGGYIALHTILTMATTYALIHVSYTLDGYAHEHAVLQMCRSSLIFSAMITFMGPFLYLEPLVAPSDDGRTVRRHRPRRRHTLGWNMARATFLFVMVVAECTALYSLFNVTAFVLDEAYTSSFGVAVVFLLTTVIDIYALYYRLFANDDINDTASAHLHGSRSCTPANQHSSDLQVDIIQDLIDNAEPIQGRKDASYHRDPNKVALRLADPLVLLNSHTEKRTTGAWFVAYAFLYLLSLLLLMAVCAYWLALDVMAHDDNVGATEESFGISIAFTVLAILFFIGYLWFFALKIADAVRTTRKRKGSPESTMQHPQDRHNSHRKRVEGHQRIEGVDEGETIVDHNEQGYGVLAEMVAQATHDIVPVNEPSPQKRNATHHSTARERTHQHHSVSPKLKKKDVKASLEATDVAHDQGHGLDDDDDEGDLSQPIDETFYTDNFEGEMALEPTEHQQFEDVEKYLNKSLVATPELKELVRAVADNVSATTVEIVGPLDFSAVKAFTAAMAHNTHITILIVDAKLKREHVKRLMDGLVDRLKQGHPLQFLHFHHTDINPVALPYVMAYVKHPDSRLHGLSLMNSPRLVKEEVEAELRGTGVLLKM